MSEKLCFHKINNIKTVYSHEEQEGRVYNFTLTSTRHSPTLLLSITESGGTILKCLLYHRGFIPESNPTAVNYNSFSSIKLFN